MSKPRNDFIGDIRAQSEVIAFSPPGGEPNFLLGHRDIRAPLVELIETLVPSTASVIAAIETDSSLDGVTAWTGKLRWLLLLSTRVLIDIHAEGKMWSGGVDVRHRLYPLRA